MAPAVKSFPWVLNFLTVYQNLALKCSHITPMKIIAWIHLLGTDRAIGYDYIGKFPGLSVHPPGPLAAGPERGGFRCCLRKSGESKSVRCLWFEYRVSALSKLLSHSSTRNINNKFLFHCVWWSYGWMLWTFNSFWRKQYLVIKWLYCLDTNRYNNI